VVSREPPWHCTVIGAAHQRKGVVCQDASLVRQLRAPAGQPLQLLAVADGHGGERYRYSDTGSRLACEQAAEAVQAALRTTPLEHQQAWQRLLSHDLPAAIQDSWLRAIQRDWQQKPDAADQPFCPSLYGSTLGLVLLAPAWWGCTGLGDWDLVRVDGDGAELLSEESEQPGGGEATASLCLAEAAARWAERAQMQPIEVHKAPFALLISTDGVRKSCATDQDFLELCSQIVPIGTGPELAEGLAEISAAGSGDDLSIAVGAWDSSSASSRPGLSAQARSVASLLVPLLLALSAAAWWAWTQQKSWTRAGQPPAATPVPIDPRPWIRQEAAQLCANPRLIGPTLAQRKGQFSELLRGTLSSQELLDAAPLDRLGALIAWSQPKEPSSEPQPPLPGSCPSLEQALARQWRSLSQLPTVLAPAPATP
jgi:serine/threonine protein phosphatase PrpC